MADSYVRLKTISILISLCFVLLPLTGCWDRNEINEIAIVLAAGLDKAEGDNIQLSLQLAIPEEMGGGTQAGGATGENPTVVIKETGSTIFEAMSQIQEQIPDRLFWGHNQAVIIGEKLAEEGIFKYIDFFSHHPQPRLRALVFVSKGEAVKALEIIPYKVSSSTELITEIAGLKVGMMVTVKDVLQMLRNEAVDVPLPWIEATFKEEKKGGVKMNGTAVLKDDKMIGKVSDELTRGILWMRDEIELATVTFKPENAEGYLSSHLIRSSTELIPSIKGDTWKITVKTTMEDDIVENQTKLDLSDEKIANKLEKQLAEQIEQRIRKTLDKVQKEMKTDIVGFSEAFERKYPKEFSKVEERWEEIFQEIEVEFDMKAYIRRAGMSTSHQGLPKEEVQDE